MCLLITSAFCCCLCTNARTADSYGAPAGSGLPKGASHAQTLLPQVSSAASPCTTGMLHCLHTTLLGALPPLVRWIKSTSSKALTYRMRPLWLISGLHPVHIHAMLWRFFHHLLSANKGREVQVIANHLQPLP